VAVSLSLTAGVWIVAHQVTSLLDRGQHGSHPKPPDPVPFPFPYSEDFEGYPKDDSNIARYFADMSGGFEVMGAHRL
jgi:hypothetical protein